MGHLAGGIECSAARYYRAGSEVLRDVWLTAEPPKETAEDTDNITSAINAATGGIINGIPIVGPSIKSGTEKFGAKVRSMIYGTPYDDELKAVQNYVKQSAQAIRDLTRLARLPERSPLCWWELV